jgi:hypothetical protein
MRSTAVVRARRLLAGLSLPHAIAQPHWLDWVGAAVAATLLGPLHSVANAAIYGPRIRAALGVRRSVISGGGSLAAHLDDW